MGADPGILGLRLGAQQVASRVQRRLGAGRVRRRLGADRAGQEERADGEEDEHRRPPQRSAAMRCWAWVFSEACLLLA